MITQRSCIGCGRDYPSPASDTTHQCWRCDFDAQFIPVIEQAWKMAIADLEAKYGISNTSETDASKTAKNCPNFNDVEKRSHSPLTDAPVSPCPTHSPQSPNPEMTYLPGALTDEQARELLTLSTVGAIFRYLDIRTAMIAHATSVEPIEATIKRATGQDVVSIDAAEADAMERIQAAIREGWRR